MSLPLILACLWALAATATAFLPMRRQFPPAIALLAAAPVLLVWIGRVHGAWVAVLLALGVVSLFRRPLRHLTGRLGERTGT
jgi:hypothetical protein